MSDIEKEIEQARESANETRSNIANQVNILIPAIMETIDQANAVTNLSSEAIARALSAVFYHFIKTFIKFGQDDIFDLCIEYLKEAEKNLTEA